MVHQLPVVQREPPLFIPVAGARPRLPQPPLLGEVLRQEVHQVALAGRRVRHLQTVEFRAPHRHVPVGDDLALVVVDVDVARRAVLQIGYLQGVGVADLLGGEHDVQLGDAEHGLGLLVLAHEVFQCVVRLGEDELPRLVFAVLLAAFHEEALHVAVGVSLPFGVAEFLSLVFRSYPLFYQHSKSETLTSYSKKKISYLLWIVLLGPSVTRRHSLLVFEFSL